MTIAALKKVTLAGLARRRDEALQAMQKLGCLHIISLARTGGTGSAGGPSSEARDALRFLLTCPQRRRQARDPEDFDPREIERQALELRDRLGDLRDERDFLDFRIRDLEPWGDFTLPPVENMEGNRLWFYVVPHRHMHAVERSDVRYQVVDRDARSCYVVVVSQTEPHPEVMPVPRTHAGSRPLRELVARLEDIEVEIEYAEADRAALTRWCTALAQNLDRLEDDAARRDAAQQTLKSEPLFGLQAWVPTERMTELAALADAEGFAFEAEDPDPEDNPPTLLANEDGFDAGEALVNFYKTPSYWSWDPSSIVLVSFAVFFGMIVADAGYALLFAAILVWYWRRMGSSPKGRRFRTLFASLTTATLIYGALVGSYFGVAPAPESPLAWIHVLDLGDSSTMMMIAVVVGVIHVILANLMNARRLGRDSRALFPVGWAAIVAGGFVASVGVVTKTDPATTTGSVVTGAGALLVFSFAGVGEKPLARIGYGLLALTNVTKAFGDVLSYLRLFALGLATASLAVAFNDMARDIREALPGVGLLFALLVLILGHSLNLILGVASGVIHGMRLNVIEFFNWGLTDEGKLFRPFRCKGV